MQKRVYMFFNFFAFNLLFFALYLNFIHKDAVAAMPMIPTPETVHISSPASRLVVPETKESMETQKTSKKLSPTKDGAALKQSIN
ncbi:hypothetical protein [Flavisolibacter tropicus]|nr:hypothetical protein [Flavisolibacter tropicus]